MRTFIAVEIEEWMRAALGRAQEELRAAGGPVRWADPQTIHLTLKFLGEVPDAQVTDVVATMRACCAGIAPFAVRAAGVGAFPDARRPRVVVVHVEAPEPLFELNRRLEDASEELGLGREDRRYVPHLTLGRLKGSKGVAPLVDRIEQMKGRSFGEIEVSEIVLMMSELGRGGAVHTPLARVELVG